MNFRQQLQEAYEAGFESGLKEQYESNLNEGVLSGILRLARLLGMADNVPLGGAKGAVKGKLAKPIFDTSAGDVLIPGPGGAKIGDPDIVAPAAKSIDDVIDDPSFDISRRRVPKQEVDDLMDLQKQIDILKKALEDLDEPIG